MRKPQTLIPIMLSMLGLLAGCGQRQQVPVGSPPADREIASQLDTRLEAALDISYSGTRNEALQNVAMDAAKAGQGEVVKKAVGAIDFQASKNKVAAETAVELAKAGQGEAAVAVAKTISFQVTRDQTLKRIADGQ